MNADEQPSQQEPGGFLRSVSLDLEHGTLRVDAFDATEVEQPACSSTPCVSFPGGLATSIGGTDGILEASDFEAAREAFAMERFSGYQAGSMAVRDVRWWSVFVAWPPEGERVDAVAIPNDTADPVLRELLDFLVGLHAKYWTGDAGIWEMPAGADDAGR